MSTTVVVINDSVARQGVEAGVWELTPDGYRFTDPAKADIEIQVVHEDGAAPIDLSRLVEWRP